ncbi:MAG: DUF1553 domain-containing protein [Fuerstiella sp.]|nr:DUF1553 domain-containing protein [Fuerstiella sp.]
MISRVIPLLSIVISQTVLTNTAVSEEAPGFEDEIAPLLIRRCVECHQGQQPSGNLLLTTRDGLLKGGDSGAVIDFDSPGKSTLLQRVHNGEMPPDKKGLPQDLPLNEIAVLERWVTDGAIWPKERTLDLFERTNEVRGGRDWWSLQPVRRPDIPKLKSLPQPEHPIDAFVRAGLESSRMVPAPTADRRTLLRRLYFDLTGLPPTRTQIEEFEHGKWPQVWDRVIDELLDSPQYGERWARYWLDLVRYADTSGYERDQEKPFAWKYRDWIVNALNSDMPYNRFVVKQLAGDELPDRNEESVIATGFLRLGTWNDEPNEPLDYQYDRLEDLVHTTSSAFLAMTVKCARCHSHKFDPITQEDYYRMGSAFWAGPVNTRDRGLLGGPNTEELGFADVLGWTDVGRLPPPLHVLKNGERAHPLHAVTPASLSMIPALERVFDPSPKTSKTSKRRLQLAEWIASEDNPLTARVMVNRLWLHHFGKGIVRSPNNFGFLADPPTHPDLLDWLAAEFVHGGWSIKRIHKLILTSETWRQSSLHPQFSEYQVQDADNRLWWRAERRRLDAESLRDAMLATTGELDRRIGGPGFRPTINAAALEGLSRKSAAWQASSPEEQRRRSLYIYSKRGLLPPMMTTFNLADATQSCGRRDVTTVPTQALVLLNNQFAHDRSETLAHTILLKTTDHQDQIQKSFSAVYGRTPTGQELSLATAHLEIQAQHFEQSDPQQSTAAAGKQDRLSRQASESLVLHLRADHGITHDPAGHVSRWKDLSGNNHDAFQVERNRQPSLVESEFNGHPAVSFDGKGHFLHLQDRLLQQQQHTIIAVVSDLGTPGHRTLLSNWNGGVGNSVNSLFLGLTSEATVRFSDAFADAGRINERTMPFTIAAVNGAGGSAVFQNGHELSSRTNPLPQRNMATNWVIGQQGNINGEFWNGGVAELRVFSKALSTDERQLIEDELHKRYGIPRLRRSPQQSPAELALASLVHVLLNSNEFIYVD